jgi:type IV pilus assembly protein PilB
MAFVDLTGAELPEETLEAVPAETPGLPGRADRVQPDRRKLKVAMKSPDNFRAVDDLRLLMGFKVEAVVADRRPDRRADQEALRQERVGHGCGQRAWRQRREVQGPGGASRPVDRPRRGDGGGRGQQGHQAAEPGAAAGDQGPGLDIHFEPFEDEFKMRYRIDGVLYEMVPPPKHLGPAITSRVKVMANLDIAERRLPQDGASS